MQFNPEKIEPVKGQYDIRISYTVVDPNYPDREKKFEASKLTSEKIDSLPPQGKTSLKIQEKAQVKVQVTEWNQLTNSYFLFIHRKLNLTS